MPASRAPRSPTGRPNEAAAPDARERLLGAGLRLFAQQGFARTSTRELAETAQVNVASISYYFGDKAGLYRAVFFAPMLAPSPGLGALGRADLPLSGALRAFYAGILAPLQQGDAARLCMKLHFREMLEPTGLWEEHLAQDIRPLHEALVALLVRELGLRQADTDVQRLAVCLFALGAHQYVGRDVTDSLAPTLNRAADAGEVWIERLTLFAQAMVEAERQRRAVAPMGASRK